MSTASEYAKASATGTVRTEIIGFVLMGLILVAVPFTSLYPYFVMKALCFALFACAFNLLIGYGGLLSFGHAMFFGTAGYVGAHAAVEWNATPEITILLAVLASTALAVMTGLIAIRRLGIYFAMITLALSQLMFFFYLQAPFTHGEDGIQGVPRGYVLGLVDLADPMQLYYFIVGSFLAAFFAVYRIVNSPFGEVLKAIRENEQRATSLGYRTSSYKLLAFILSGALAGFAGSLKVFVVQNASLTDVHWAMSGEVVLMTLVGGLGTIFGPVVGAFVVVGMQQYLASVGTWVTVIQGFVFIVCVVAFRRGIVGEIAARLKCSL